ncbi:MAG: hypothetical protein AMJ43_05305 [Coxiella sp. DG_40]|nr:MAG: hypothetical protein AMJ43_05305 [Coxiella sp. DG_40]
MYNFFRKETGSDEQKQMLNSNTNRKTSSIIKNVGFYTGVSISTTGCLGAIYALINTLISIKHINDDVGLWAAGMMASMCITVAGMTLSVASRPEEWVNDLSAKNEQQTPENDQHQPDYQQKAPADQQPQISNLYPTIV